MASASDPIAAYRAYGPALVRKAARILRSHDDALDIVQTLFVDLMAKPGTNLELPYLYRAVTNRCLNAIRDRDNRARLLEAHAPAASARARSRCDDRVVDLDLLCKLSDRLDARSLEIVVCLYLDDMTQDETAALIGISRRAVVKRLARVRSALAELGDDNTEVAS